MPDKPNILWIISDQHNPHIAGYVGDSKARTQNLDKLAGEGMRFDSTYCQSPLCVPSRISMLTGKYVYNCSAWANASVLYPDDVTLPEQLANYGYTTALVGKMHLKGPKWMGGFQHRPYGDLVIDRFCFHQPDPPHTWDNLWCNHQVGRFAWAGETQIPESLLADGVVTRESLAFIFEHIDKTPDKPWFLCAGYSRPHFPFTVPGRYLRRAMADEPALPARPEGYPDKLHPHDKYLVDDFHVYDFPDDVQQKTLAAYYACVDYVDDCIGELIDGLEKAGALENTYIIYNSDHGDMTGEHGMWSKRTYYDASAAAPLIIKGPGIPEGKVISCPAELVDLYPTLCELVGTPVPEGLDGESLAPILRGETESKEKRFARSELLFPNKEVAFRMVRDARWKYVDFPEAPARLFDMLNDPAEDNDLLASGGDVSEAPLDELKKAVSAGLSWEEIDAMVKEETARRPASPKAPNRGPVQYQLADGRVVDGDNFLYKGLSECRDSWN